MTSKEKDEFIEVLIDALGINKKNVLWSWYSRDQIKLYTLLKKYYHPNHKKRFNKLIRDAKAAKATNDKFYKENPSYAQSNLLT